MCVLWVSGWFAAMRRLTIQVGWSVQIASCLTTYLMFMFLVTTCQIDLQNRVSFARSQCYTCPIVMVDVGPV
jgi:hypothetical protein